MKKRKMCKKIVIGCVILCVLIGLPALLQQILLSASHKSTTIQATLPPQASTTTVSPPDTTTQENTTPPSTLPAPSLASLFPTYRVYGTLKVASRTYPAGKVFEIRNGKHEAFYYAYDEEQNLIKLPWESVAIEEPPALSLPPVSKATIEKAANEWGFQSKTDYLVWANLYRTETYIFKRNANKWSLLLRCDAASGDKLHPTPLGTFEVEGKYDHIGKAGEYICKYATGFHGNYLFHSVIYDFRGENITDNRLSQHISKGCIRLNTDHAKWIYDHIPLGTAVYIQ